MEEFTNILCLIEFNVGYLDHVKKSGFIPNYLSKYHYAHIHSAE